MAYSTSGHRRRGQARPLLPTASAGLPAMPEMAAPPPKRKYRSGRCDCGKCVRCIDNTRWSTVFDEKFADPFYYADKFLRHNSPLAPA